MNSHLLCNPCCNGDHSLTAMANHSGLCSHGNYSLEGNVTGLELEKKELARPVTVDFLVAMAFKLGSHLAKLRESYIQNEVY